MGFLTRMFSGGVSYDQPPQYFQKDAERQARLEQYKRTWDAYLAELPDPLIQDGPSNDNVKVNPARAIINTGVYFLFGSEVKFQISQDAQERFGTGQTSDDSKPNKVADPAWLKDLNKAWRANRKESFLFNLGLSGGIHGTPFIYIMPNAAGHNNRYPKLQLLDPANVDVEWDPNDCNKVLKYCIEYITEDEDDKPVIRSREITANMDENEVIQNWTIQDYEQSMVYDVGMTNWVPMAHERREVGPPTLWNYSWPPIEHCQNVELPHMFWGLPDLDESSIEVIESIQRSMSSMNKIVRIHAAPRMFAKNVLPDQVNEIDVSADNIITLPNMEADLAVLQTLSNLSPSIQYAEKQREMLLEMVQIPPISLGEFETASTAISGVTLSILYAPILQKTTLKRISYGDMLERLNLKLLELLGHEDFEEYEDSLVIVWPEAMPGSTYLERQTLEQDMNMGVSKHTLTQRLGYDPKEEQKHRMDEMEEELKLQEKYAPEPSFGSSGGFGANKGETRGGNNNPGGKGNKSGSLGGTNSAGTPKTPTQGSTPRK